jgi:hypothetical protein
VGTNESGPQPWVRRGPYGWEVDEDLKKALDELDEAEKWMVENGDDSSDEFYTTACHLVYTWRAIKNPKLPKPPKIQTGIEFSLAPDGSSRIRSI